MEVLGRQTIFGGPAEELPVGRSNVLQFVEAWSDLDPYASNYIPIMKLGHLLTSVPPPLGVKGQEDIRTKMINVLMGVDIPLRNQKVHFLETLYALAGRVAGAELPDDEERKIRSNLTQRLPQPEEGAPKYTAAHFYAALHVQAAIRGFLTRLGMDEGHTEKTNNL